MGMKTRKQYLPALKANIVLEVLRETKTIAELAADSCGGRSSMKRFT